ncbi:MULTISPECIES: DUF1471 domain-containing protein [Serratia]|uniref:DUF1471 domain-containing protein n=1 Tax=Serratia TaxID=613 RepID=UPI000744F234|nr:DUF1471 domain-containing protein [Serratia marcescens]CAI1587167.1 Multiple stress resistance protein BhsA precursor [Serratia marcescens]CVF69911.1 Multiple stress resistance protein BhsA precursor [Serratia marcescens]
MKNVMLKTMLLGAFVFSGATVAATQINSQLADALTPRQVITVSGAANLSDAEKMLADKTDKAGARYYKIIAIVGNNKLHASAMTYQ